MGPTLRARRSNGFTLIEILLVIGILMGVGIVEMRKDVAKARESSAAAAGKQLALVAKAAEQYMAAKSAALQAMTDPNCPQVGSTCTLSVAAMISEGYLPADFINVVSFGGSYAIQLARVAPPTPTAAKAAVLCGNVNPTPIGCTDQSGSIPNWQYSLQGLVYTTLPWKEGGSAINWGLLGQAAKQAGPLAGVTQLGSAQGLYGGWSMPGATFGATLLDGQLVYMIGSQTNLWSQFVRRDGSLPMTGSLDMGSFSVLNMRDMFLNGPPTNPRNKNLSSLLPNWVFKGAYSAKDGDFVPAPVCGSTGGVPKIKLMMQLMEGTRAQYYNDSSGSVSSATSAAIADFSAGTITAQQAQATVQSSLASNAAIHSMNSWAEENSATALTGWTVHFQDRFNIDDASGSENTVKGRGLAELYCHFPDQ